MLPLLIVAYWVLVPEPKVAHAPMIPVESLEIPEAETTPVPVVRTFRVAPAVRVKAPVLSVSVRPLAMVQIWSVLVRSVRPDWMVRSCEARLMPAEPRVSVLLVPVIVTAPPGLLMAIPCQLKLPPSAQLPA